MRRQLLRLWKASQPYLRLPRRWVAFALRRINRRTTFIAITGSNGKTTTSRCLAAILSGQAPTQSTRINRNSMPGITETIAFCNPLKTRYAVLEVAAGTPDAIRKAARLIRPKVVVVLCVFLEHRGLFRTIEAVAEEKARLLMGLVPGGLAVVNGDDPLVDAMAVPPACRRVRYGASPGCDFRYEDPRSAWPDLLSFTAVVHGQRQEIRSRLLGSHWVGSLLAAIAVATELGVPLHRIASAIEEMPPYPGRMQVVRLPVGAVVVRDEYKGSPHTIEVAFDEMGKARADRKFLVFGDVAESSRGPRKRLNRIGREAVGTFDHIVFVGENSQYGVDGARKAGLPESQVRAFTGYAEAADHLRPLLGPGDLVLFKADRGNHLTRIFYSLLEEVRCTIPSCDRNMVCDDCPEFRNPDLVRQVNDQLTVRVR